jgi:polar amino acid transport system substrate-binding protein
VPVRGRARAGAGADRARRDDGKKITIAIPTDFPPYGFVGTDLKPQGLDIDMATLHRRQAGRAVELVPVTSANRIPYLQTKKADLVISTLGKNPEREKVIDFTAAYSPFFQACSRPRRGDEVAGRPGRQDRLRHARRHRGHGADQDRAASADIKRFEDNNATVSAFVSGQVQADRHRRIGGRQHDGAQPAAGHRIQASC